MAGPSQQARNEELKYSINVQGYELARFRTLKEQAAAQALFDEAVNAFMGSRTISSDQVAEFKSLVPAFRLVVTLAPAFFSAAQEGDADKLEELIEQGMPLNLPDPATGATALHYAATHGARDALLVLLTTGQCDLLLRDRKGRLASELASLYGQDPAMARLLRYKEVQQASAQGLKLRRRERASRKK